MKIQAQWINCPNNFLNQKICNLVDDWDFDQKFYIHRGEFPLSKTANNFEKYCFIFPEKILKYWK